MNLDKLMALSLELLSPDLEKWTEGEPYRRFLYHLILDRKPQAVLEIGVDRGCTSLIMAAAAHKVGALSFGIDCKTRTEIIQEAEDKYGYKFLFCDSLGAAATIRQLLGNKRLGVVFQDSSHHAEPSRLEWEYYRPMLAANFVWLCDDITPSFKLPDEPKGMVDYFNALPGNKRLFPGLHIGNVIGIIEP